MASNIEQQLAEQGVYVSTTVGWSMFPMLRNRKDRIVILPIGDQRLKKYDLPLYRRPDGKYVLHRILKVKENHYVIRGDNTYRLEHVPDEWILGYVSEFYRNGKHVDSNSRAYRAYVTFWRIIYPFRYVAYHALLLAIKLHRKIFPKKNNSEQA